MKPAAIARAGIVQVPETRELFGDLSVRENLDLGGQHFPKAESARQREWLYELFPILKDRETQSARTLSGGEQQMLTIARALMSRPRLLLLDEPSLGLAPLVVKGIFDAIRELNRTDGMTIFLVEQNAYHALKLAHRGYVLVNGRVTMSGTGRALLDDPNVQAAYLEGGHAGPVGT